MTTRPLLDRTDLPRDGVTEVSIIDADGAGNTYVREADGWWMIDPYRHRVRTEAIQHLFDAMMLTVEVDSIDDADEALLDRYALQPPRASVLWSTERASVAPDRSGS